MLMNQNKIDEGTTVLSDLNIAMTMERIRKRYDFEISEEEIDYYVKHHSPKPIQTQLVYAYFTKYLGSYRDSNVVTRRQYIELLLILKKQLLVSLGYDGRTEDNKVYHASLPYILTGNLEDKVNTRIIRNNKFVAKLEENLMYKELIENKYRLLGYLKPEAILSLLSSIINTRFTYVTYEQPELLGREIVYSEDKVSDELLSFLLLNCE